MMKQEASLEQWNSLYQAAAAVTKLAPLGRFLEYRFNCHSGEQETGTAVYERICRGIHNRGVTMYIGNEGLEDF